MNTLLVAKLHSYIVENNPDLLVELQGDRNVTAYLNNKVLSIDLLIAELRAAGEPEYMIEEKCIEELTKDLRPSKYNYFYELLQEEFPIEFQSWRETGILTYEIISLIATTERVFTDFKFSEETQENRELYYTITGAISEYLNKAVIKEKV